MKLLNKILFIFALVGLTTACENFELDLQENPNEITPDRASLNDLYNGIQLDFSNIYFSAQDNPGALARMYAATAGFNYNAVTTPATFNGLWTNIYAGLFTDVEALLGLAEPQGFDIHAGTAKIMKAYTMMVLVDLFGNVPFSEATQGTDIISPKADNGQDIYNSAVALIDEAIGQMSGSSAATPATEQFYGGDTEKWIAFGNTLKLRAALQQRLVDPSGAAATINSIVSGGSFIDEASEDFQFNYGSQRDNPNSRHWMYNNHYEANDGDYLSNYYMWLLRSEKKDAEGVTIIDPRIRYYFYRKIEKADEQDQTTYSCHFSALPIKADANNELSHWEAVDPDLPYCIVLPGDGYSGRDHLNGEGIPPDGPTRSSYGLYPGGGQFDWDQFQDTRKLGTTGGRGAGIDPILLSSFVDFMRAEAALTIGTNDDPKILLESGIRKSMAKVESFESLVPGTFNAQVEIRGVSTPVKELFGLSEERIDNYVNEVLRMYDEASGEGKLDVVIKEFYIAAWGNGLEAYNMYRRTGLPANMQPGIEPQVGEFPRSVFLPDNHVTRNSNVSQKALTDRVFWDDGSVDLY